ncbi:MAG: DUF6186 family protein [Acidimicrobiales bacterium]
MRVQRADDAIWAVLAVALLVLLALSHLPRPPIARLTAAIRSATTHPVAFVALMLGWAWLGWHSFAR